MSIERIQKRDGRIANFEPNKITDVIFKAAVAVGGSDRKLSEDLSKKVIKLLEETFPNGEIPCVEDVQDAVEKILIKNGHAKTAKAYILYRDRRARVRDSQNLLINIKELTDGYLSQADWRVRENGNMTYSLSGLMMHVTGAVLANYTLSNVYPPEISEAHRKGDIHMHDLGMGISGYCAGWSLRQLLMEGFNGVPGKIDSTPPKHLDSALWQMINFIGTLQNEWAGAQAFSSFDTFLAPFIKTDKLNYDKVKQAVQGFIFNMNVPSRWGGQCVSEDTECLTNNGWKFYKEISSKDKIATFNVKTKKIEYLKQERVKEYDYDGYLIKLSNRTQEQLVTPNHKVVRKVFNSNKYVLEEAEDLLKLKTGVMIPNSASTNSKEEVKDYLIELIAWLVSEGTFSEDRKRVSLFQSEKNKSKVEKIRKCLRENDFKWDETKRIHGFGNNYTIRFRLNQESSRKVRKTLNSKQVPEFVKKLSKRQIKLFIDTYVLGDGHVEKNGRTRIYTKDEGVLNSLQELCSLCEYGTTVYQRENGVYTINLIRNNDTLVKLSKVKYKGKVWCPTTKNGTFVARRKGNVFITGNTPFSNLTFDWMVPDDLKNAKAIVGGKEMDFNYGDCQKEMDMINKAFLEVMMSGDASGRIFTFPIPTYNITKDFDWDSENAKILFDMTAKYGIPYFQNFINSDLKPSDIRSMCCRLQMDMRELRKRGNGLFGAAEMTGSIGVITLNMARIGYLSKNKEDFLFRVEKQMTIAKNSLEIKRKVVEKNMEGGLMPFSKRYLGTLKNHFSTIGLNGMNEAMLNFMGKDLSDPEAIKFTKDVLEFMRNKIKEIQEETGHMYNLEATPAEGVSYRFAKKDVGLFPDIIVANPEEFKKGAEPYYTNSTTLPVDLTDDLFQALELQDDLQTLYTGGTVFHAFLKENLNSGETCKKLVQKVAESFKMPYFTVTPTFSICPVHGYLKGRVWTCPHEHTEAQIEKWGAKREEETVIPCEVFSRVVGYFRPVQQWNDGKQSEFMKRKEFSNEKLLEKAK